MFDANEFRQQAQATTLNRARVKVVKDLVKLLRLEEPFRPGEASDPLVQFCWDRAILTEYGKLGLYFQPNITPKPFGQMLAKPVGATKDLEEGLNEAFDVYPVVKGERIGWLAGLVFLVGDKRFVYTHFIAPVGDASMLVVRSNGGKRQRAIYTLEGFLAVIGVIEPAEETP